MANDMGCLKNYVWSVTCDGTSAIVKKEQILSKLRLALSDFSSKDPEIFWIIVWSFSESRIQWFLDGGHVFR